MRTRSFLLAGLLVTATGLVISGCGGEAGGEIEMVGIYWGDVFGDDTGIIRFYISPRGALNGNVRLSACADPIQIVGIVDASGAVTWSGTGCGVTFNGTGNVEQLAPGSPVWVGQGTWKATNGTRGTWGVRRQARTGSISV